MTTSDEYLSYNETIYKLVSEEKEIPAYKNLKSWGLFFVTVVIFFGLGLFDWSIKELIVLTIVLLVHESGHLIGMLLLKYQNLKMFFIPFFGAAVSGTPDIEKQTSAKNAIVAMLGPAPGLLIGIVFGIVYIKFPTPIVKDFSMMFIILNGFNLIPFLPLDGGQIFNSLIFNRSKYLEIIFILIAVIGFVGLAYKFNDVVFLIISGLMLISIPYKIKLFKIVSSHAGRLHSKKDNVSNSYPDATMVSLVGDIKKTFPDLFKQNAAGSKIGNISNIINEVTAKVNLRKAGFLSSTSLLLLYSFFCVIAIASLVFISPLDIKDEIFLDSKTGTRMIRTYVYKDIVSSEFHLDKNNLFHGKYRSYNFYDGKLISTGKYIHGLLQGEWRYFNEDDKLSRVENYDHNQLVSIKLLKGSKWNSIRLSELPEEEQSKYLKINKDSPKKYSFNKYNSVIRLNGGDVSNVTSE